jgi:aspartate aminotransferase
MPPAPPFTPTANTAQLRESATIAVSQRARALRAEGRPIIDLGAGEPDFPTPQFILQAATRALQEGATKYTAVEGILPLRQAIANAANERWKGSDAIAATDVVVTTGSKQALFDACFSLFGPGDEVLIPTPSWTSYYEMTGLARATAVPVFGEPTRGFKVTPAMLQQHATPRTRGLFLNSPTNPTGGVYSEQELRAILTLAADRGWWTISDEIYRRISYEAPAPSSLDVAPSRDRLVVVDGVAKAYAMTGWRVGWSISPAPLARAMTALQSHTTSNTATISQHAALAALEAREQADAAVATMVAEFRRRRDAALAIVRSEPRITLLEPQGAFYLFMRAPGAGRVADSGTAFATHVLEHCDVAIVPGAAFHTSDWVRISYAADRADVEEGVRRVVAAYRTLA